MSKTSRALTHLSRTMEGLATRDEAKEAVESIAVATEMRSGSEWPQNRTGEGQSLKVSTVLLECFGRLKHCAALTS